MTEDLLALLASMKSHAHAERAAMRALDSRQLFELARESESLAQRLGQLLSHTSEEDLGSQAWAEVCRRAAEVRALARANFEIMRRSLEVIRAVKRPMPVPHDTPAFVSQRA